MFYRNFGTTLSLSQRQTLRLSQSFESYEQAKSRVEVTQRKIQNGSKRKKDHVGDISKFNFDEESCIHEVNSYNENDEINFSALARKYNLKSSNGILPTNAGQIVKEILLSMDCDLSRFSNCHPDSEFHIRRKKRRQVS